MSAHTTLQSEQVSTQPLTPQTVFNHVQSHSSQDPNHSDSNTDQILIDNVIARYVNLSQPHPIDLTTFADPELARIDVQKTVKVLKAKYNDERSSQDSIEQGIKRTHSILA